MIHRLLSGTDVVTSGWKNADAVPLYSTPLNTHGPAL